MMIRKNKINGVGGEREKERETSLYSIEFLVMDEDRVREPFLVKECTFVL